MPRQSSARPSPLDVDGLYDKAVAALARRSRSEAEIRRLLRPRATSAEAIQEVLERLHDHHYLDDARLAAAVASYEIDVFHHGSRRALRDLRARGVAAETAQRAVTASYAGSDEDRLLREYLRKKRCTPPLDLRQTAKLYRKLLVAGFSPAAGQRALRQLKLNPEWLEAIEQIEWEPGELSAAEGDGDSVPPPEAQR